MGPYGASFLSGESITGEAIVTIPTKISKYMSWVAHALGTKSGIYSCLVRKCKVYHRMQSVLPSSDGQ